MEVGEMGQTPDCPPSIYQISQDPWRGKTLWCRVLRDSASPLVCEPEGWRPEERTPEKAPQWVAGRVKTGKSWETQVRWELNARGARLDTRERKKGETKLRDLNKG